MQLDHPNRELARLAGNKQYFTGIVCKNNHMSNRWVINGSCVECMINIKTKHKKTEKFKTTTKAYSKNYKPKILLKLYGLSNDDYEKLLKEQNNKCKICETELQVYRKTHVDHCHATGKVRGLLCHGCNLGLGHLKHNPEFLRKAALYCEQS